MAVQETTTQTVLPDWYTQYAKNVLSKAYEATSEPYQAYQGARVAGFAPEQEQAFETVKSNVGAYKPYLAAAGQAIGQGIGSFTSPGVAEQYMNPYTQQVVAGIGQAAGRNLIENILPGINRTFVGGGTFGGSRSAEFTQRAIRDANAAALAEQSKALQTGYNTAADLYGTEASRALQGATAYSNLGQQQQALAGTEAAALESIGQQRQALGQKSADLAYQDFLAQRDNPYTQVQRLAAIGGSPSAAGTGASTKTETSPGTSNTASTLGTIVGIAGTLGSIFGKKSGGVIKKKAGLGWLKDKAA